MNIAKQNIYQRDTALYSWPTFFKISVFFFFFSSWKLISQFIHRISNFKNPPFLSSYNIPFLMHMLYHGWMDLDQNSEWHLWLKKKRNDVIHIARPRISILRVLNAAKINRTKKKKKRKGKMQLYIYRKTRIAAAAAVTTNCHHCSHFPADRPRLWCYYSLMLAEWRPKVKNMYINKSLKK